MDSKDIRLSILEKLDQENKSTAEFIANEFLETLHSDLGTIIRAVNDLVDDGYIKESPPSDIRNAVKNWENKSSKRLLNPNDIPSIRLFITLRGKQFLVESGNLKRTTWNLKNEWWVRLAYLIAGALIVVAVNRLTGNADSADTQADKQPQQLESSKNISDSTSDNVEEDCVFNNDYKGLTKDWLTQLKIRDFIWRDDLKQALIPKGQDTVFISKGGCTHLGLLVELKLTNDNHPLTDSVYWVNKALGIAFEYQMDHYDKMIKEGRIRKAESGQKTTWYEIDDNDSEDNLVYNGIEIVENGRTKRVSISQYFN
jgi:hypothetical protein